MSQQEQQAEHDKQAPKDKTFSITVRATNGATWQTEFKQNEKVSKVIKESLDHFIAEGAMSQGDYRLVLIVNDQAQPPLPENAKLDETAVKDGALLALVPRDPQVDG
jgi:hypothetical protein